LCAICDQGYFFESTLNQCAVCQPGGMSAMVFVILAAILIYPFFILISVIFNRLGVHLGDAVYFEAEDFMTTIFFQLSIKWTKYRISVVKLSRSFQKKLLRKCEQASLKLNSKLKIFVSMFQIISSMKHVLDISFPPGFSGVTSFMNVFNLGTFGLSCTVTFDFIDYLLFVTILPIVVIVVLMLFHQRYALTKSIFGVNVEDRIVGAWQSKIFFFLLFFLFFILPSVSSTIFRMFTCENIDPDNASGGSNLYLRADYTIACDSDRYHFGMWWAVGCIFLYPLGVPLFYYKVLFDNRENIVHRNEPFVLKDEMGQVIMDEEFPDDVKVDEDLTRARDDALHSVRFLFWQYEPEYWYWEVVETVRKILLTGALVLVDQGSTLQIIVGYAVSKDFMVD